MKKFTYNMTAGITYSFPSCKTFVFLRTDYDVSFKFISLWNKVDKEIEGFKDSFSITADEYFLQVRVVSSVDQEVSAILIDDAKVLYQPIMGEVTISNTPLPVQISGQPIDVHLDNASPNDVTVTNTSANRAGMHSYVDNNRSYPIPTYSPEGIMVDQKINSDKFYKGLYSGQDGYLGRHKGWGYVESQQAASDLECYCVFPWVKSADNNPLYTDAYLTHLEIIPETDNFLELWVAAVSTGTHRDYSTLVKTLVNPDGKVKTTQNTVLISSEVWYKNVTRASLVAAAYEECLCSYPIKAGVPFVLPMAKPIRLDVSTTTAARYLTEFLTITTKTNCHFSFNVQIELFEQYFNTNEIFTPYNFG